MQDSTLVLLVNKVEQTIIALSSGIGKSAEYVYPIFVKQQIIEAIIPIVLFIPAFITLLLSYKKVKSWDAPTPMAVIVVVSAITSFIAFLILIGLISQLLNPEYAAMIEIMNTVAKLK